MVICKSEKSQGHNDELLTFLAIFHQLLFYKKKKDTLHILLYGIEKGGVSCLPIDY